MSHWLSFAIIFRILIRPSVVCVWYISNPRMTKCYQSAGCASCPLWVWERMSTPLLSSWQRVPEISPATCSGVNPTLPVWARLCRLPAWWLLNTLETKHLSDSFKIRYLCVFIFFSKLRYQKCLDARPPSLASCLPTPPADSVARRVKKGVQSLLGSFKSYRSGSQSPWVGSTLH